MCVFLTEKDLELISISKVKFFVGLTLRIVLKEPNVKFRVIKNIKKPCTLCSNLNWILQTYVKIRCTEFLWKYIWWCLVCNGYSVQNQKCNLFYPVNIKIHMAVYHTTPKLHFQFIVICAPPKAFTSDQGDLNLKIGQKCCQRI